MSRVCCELISSLWSCLNTPFNLNLRNVTYNHVAFLNNYKFAKWGGKTTNTQEPKTWMKNVSCYRLNLITAFFHRKRSRKRAVSFNAEEYLPIYWTFLLKLIRNINWIKIYMYVYKKIYTDWETIHLGNNKWRKTKVIEKRAFVVVTWWVWLTSKERRKCNVVFFNI